MNINLLISLPNTWYVKYKWIERYDTHTHREREKGIVSKKKYSIYSVLYTVYTVSYKMLDVQSTQNVLN